MTDFLSLQAPAKLNLMLHITGRRDDGYHLLETVFQFVDLFDRLDFTLTAESEIKRLGGNTSVPEADDLVLKAARLLQQRFGVRKGVSIEVNKVIPVGGGLGGGSSDAATCLLALNRLWNLQLSLDQLAQTGLELGADVPVFVRGEAAWATGVGDQLSPLELPASIYLVINPNVAVSTAQIFAAQELTRNCDPLTIRAFLRGSGHNVCEPVVRKLHPRVGEALDWLAQFSSARLSGTGACLFAGFDSLEQAEVVKSQVPERWTAYLVRSMNRSPVHQQLGLLE